ncbi:MAG: prolyl oligopeptidase family serine peptidase [Planctomycetota bacterium]
MRSLLIVTLLVSWIGGLEVNAQTCALESELYPPSPSSPQQDRGRFSRGVYKSRIRARWIDDHHFWYRNDLRGGAREFVLVDGEAGTRAAAFDQEALAAALRDAGVGSATAARLPIEDLEFDLEERSVDFSVDDRHFRWQLEAGELSALEERDDAGEQRGLAPRADIPRQSISRGGDTELTFINRLTRVVEIFWLDGQGQRRSYGRIEPGERHAQHTYAGHVWEVVAAGGRSLGVYRAEESAGEVILSSDMPEPRRSRRRPFEGRPAGGLSPDGRLTAITTDGNLYLRDAEGAEVTLTTDGTEDFGYQRVEWSPDSTRLVAFKIDRAETLEVHLIESSPEGGGRARLSSRPYPLPGDELTTYELHLFDAEGGKPIACDVDPIDFGRPRLRWAEDGRTFTYEKVDRGHQRFRLIEVDVTDGSSRNLIDERTDTFIWTAHAESAGVPLITWLEGGDELIYASERDGWRHLYLVDVEEGRIRNQITRGEWIVRGIDEIDEDRREIWFRASGRNEGQDPYLIHHYRIGLDGEGLVALTEGHGTHSIEYSPGRDYLIDSYSRVDQAPIHELRRVSDGSLIIELEQADTTELEARGWQAPEVFVAKGRDGETDIWGILCRPRDHDPEQSYAIIEDIYAGPQGSFVPKAFSSRDYYRSLTDLGFVVVKIDGMGTANRSKAFHDVCWKNLKDAGFEDRILWMKAAAEKDPSLDIDRVGIYGTSAGGQNAAGAVLFHPEFYKAAVANCGCHDNRMDKASWNEQWMGYPVGPWYGESSNIDNAHRLEGHLMLVVGELDRNVPPESTYRLVDALVRAGKDFDFLFVPGGGHGAGGAYGQRRLQDFFLEHLQGKAIPNRNASEGRGRR